MKEQINFNNYREKLTQEDKEQIIDVITKRCRVNTINRIRSVLTYDASKIPKFGILNRLVKETYGWTYIVGQYAPSEYQTIRDIFLGKIKE
jgi:hypothetical protein